MSPALRKLVELLARAAYEAEQRREAEPPIVPLPPPPERLPTDQRAA